MIYSISAVSMGTKITPLLPALEILYLLGKTKTKRVR